MMLGVSGADWDTARDSLGETRASLCLLLADRNSKRTGKFGVRNPVGAFFGLARKESARRRCDGNADR